MFAALMRWALRASESAAAWLVSWALLLLLAGANFQLLPAGPVCLSPGTHRRHAPGLDDTATAEALSQLRLSNGVAALVAAAVILIGGCAVRRRHESVSFAPLQSGTKSSVAIHGTRGPAVTPPPSLIASVRHPGGCSAPSSTAALSRGDGGDDACSSTWLLVDEPARSEWATAASPVLPRHSHSGALLDK